MNLPAIDSPPLPEPTMTDPSSWPALYGPPTIQKRVSIARPPAPPTEDSDVLVLNSRSTLPCPSVVGAEVLYLDLRLSIPSAAPVHINWAFAGVRETIPLEEGEDNAMRYHWRHAIDSHGSGEPLDKGTMVKRNDENGESVEVETGVGIDPETGKMGPYEEVWREEYIPPGTPFAFVTSDSDPNQSTRFLAIIGSYAVGLSQPLVANERLASDDTDEPRHFHAVRLRNDAENRRSGEAVYRKVFSTGNQILDDQLEKFVGELQARERGGKRLWKRGERLTLRDNKGRDMTWVVWDAGRVVH